MILLLIIKYARWKIHLMKHTRVGLEPHEYQLRVASGIFHYSAMLDIDNLVLLLEFALELQCV